MGILCAFEVGGWCEGREPETHSLTVRLAVVARAIECWPGNCNVLSARGINFRWRLCRDFSSPCTSMCIPPGTRAVASLRIGCTWSTPLHVDSRYGLLVTGRNPIAAASCTSPHIYRHFFFSSQTPPSLPSPPLWLTYLLRPVDAIENYLDVKVPDEDVRRSIARISSYSWHRRA